jgi:hypothetical protein
MKDRAESPLIQRIEWGQIEVEGLGAGKDVKLWPGGGRAWDWRETGTKHVPGIQISDVTELLEQGSGIVVLSRGMQLVLQTCPETLAFLEGAAKTVHVLETREAVRLYNSLSAGGHPVGGIFHSTC